MSSVCRSSLLIQYADSAYSSSLSIVSTHPQATPIATPLPQSLSQAFFCRPDELVAPDLIGCLLVKRQEGGELLWGVIVETAAYSHDELPVTATAAAPPATKRCLVSLGGFMCM